MNQKQTPKTTGHYIDKIHEYGKHFGQGLILVTELVTALWFTYELVALLIPHINQIATLTVLLSLAYLLSDDAEPEEIFQTLDKAMDVQPGPVQQNRKEMQQIEVEIP